MVKSLDAGPRVLFVTYGGGHADIVARLLDSLAEIGVQKPTVLALTTAQTRLKETICNLRGCSDYLPAPGYEKALETGESLAKSLWNADSGVSWNETCAYLGASMTDLEATEGTQNAKLLYEEKGRKAFLPIQFLHRVLDIEKPDLVITTCQVRMERAATAAALARGIPTVLIEDLFGYSLLGEYTFSEPGDLLDASSWPDHVVVMNNAVSDILETNGFPASRIKALGQPVLSDWQKEFWGASVPLQLKDVVGPIVTYVGPARREVLFSQSRYWIELAKMRPEWTFCIKLHPSVSRDEFTSEMDALPSNVVVFTAESIIDVVASSDVVTLFRSTVGMLCLITGHPLIIWDTTGEPEYMPYAGSGAAPAVRKNANLLSTIEDMLRDTRIQKESSTHPLFECQPNAGERIAKWIATFPSQY